METKIIAHRLGFMMNGYPENSIQNVNYLLMLNKKEKCIDGLEFDIRFTKDGIPVVIHDDCLADISDSEKHISKENFNDIKSIKCGYRKSEYQSDINWNENKNYYLSSLEELLNLLNENIDESNIDMIRIETKNFFLSAKHIQKLTDIFFVYPELAKKIVHISFFPWNLNKLYNYETKEHLVPTKTELLLDSKLCYFLESLYKHYINGVSLSVKADIKESNLQLSKKAKKVSSKSRIFTINRNSLTIKRAIEAIKKYGYLNIYTINSEKELKRIIDILSLEFITNNSKTIYITTDNPKQLIKKH